MDNEIEKLSSNTPNTYERRKPQVDEFVRWCGRIAVFLLVILIVLMLGFWDKLDKIYNGNPQSNGRELLCALARDDAIKDETVNPIFEEACDEFTELKIP